MCWNDRASASASIPHDLQRVVATAIARAGHVAGLHTCRNSGQGCHVQFDPRSWLSRASPAGTTLSTIFAGAPRKRGERISEWRRKAPIRAIAFEPPRLPDGRDAPDVVQVHLEHRLVRRLLSRFLSQGFQSDLVTRLRHRRSGRTAARGAAGPARALWRRRRASARRDHPGDGDLDRSRARPQAARAARRKRRGANARSARGGVA